MPRDSGSGMRPVLSGSGKLGTPWARMHGENLSASAVTYCTWAGVGPLPPFGSRCRQALCAARNRELSTPSCCSPTFGIAPPRPGSGKLGTPPERMQWEKASACADALDGELLCVVGEPSCATWLACE